MVATAASFATEGNGALIRNRHIVVAYCCRPTEINVKTSSTEGQDASPPTNSDPANLFGMYANHYDSFDCSPIFGISVFLDFHTLRFPDLLISRCSDSQISRLRRTNSQIPKWPLCHGTQGLTVKHFAWSPCRDRTSTLKDSILKLRDSKLYSGLVSILANHIHTHTDTPFLVTFSFLFPRSSRQTMYSSKNSQPLVGPWRSKNSLLSLLRDMMSSIHLFIHPEPYISHSSELKANLSDLKLKSLALDLLYFSSISPKPKHCTAMTEALT